MPTTAAFSARNSRASFDINTNSYFLFARKWTVGVKVDELDVTTFEELGFANFEDGIMEGDVSLDGYWDVRMNATGLDNSIQAASTAPPVIYPGAVLANYRCYVKGANKTGANGTTANPVAASGLTVGSAATYPSYLFPSLKLFTCTVDAGVRGTLDVAFSGKGQGAFYLPGQSSAVTNPRNVWY